MKFRGRKDILFQTIIFGLAGFLLSYLLTGVFSKTIDLEFIALVVVMSLILILLIWIQYSTHYQLSAKELLYKSGPIKGKIEIASIREIIVGKSLWVGLKPATARKGLIIKYNKYDEIYISPRSNESFVEKIKELNPGIKIFRPNKKG